MLYLKCIKSIIKFTTADGKEPFNEWINTLDRLSNAKIRAYIDRVALGGSLKNVKPVGDGVMEIKIDIGPGYRVYFGEKENTILLLLLGGDKSSQNRDIKKSREYWRQANV